MNEAETRAEHIDPALQAAGWGVIEGSRIRREYPISPGRIEGHGKRGKPLTADYVLEFRNTKLAVVEAKAWDEELTEGVGQAKNYAAKLAVRHTYATNGRGIYGIDHFNFPVAGNSIRTSASRWGIPFTRGGGTWTHHGAERPIGPSTSDCMNRMPKSSPVSGRARLAVTHVDGASTVTSAFVTSPMKLLVPKPRGVSTWIWRTAQWCVSPVAERRPWRGNHTAGSRRWRTCWATILGPESGEPMHLTPRELTPRISRIKMTKFSAVTHRPLRIIPHQVKPTADFMKNFATLLMVVLWSAGCASGPRGFPGRDGIPNLAEVNSHLYRGAQPTTQGIHTLRDERIRTIINLRMPGDVVPEEETEARACGIIYTNVPLCGWSAPTDAQVAQVLSLIETSPGAVFIHCKYGCDRTGTIIACYRIKHDLWVNGRALKEAEDYGMSRWEPGMKHYIREFGKADRPK